MGRLISWLLIYWEWDHLRSALNIKHACLQPPLPDSFSSPLFISFFFPLFMVFMRVRVYGRTLTATVRYFRHIYVWWTISRANRGEPGEHSGITDVEELKPSTALQASGRFSSVCVEALQCLKPPIGALWLGGGMRQGPCPPALASW